MEDWYVYEQQARDRLTEARAVARAHALMRELAPPHRGRYVVGIALIRLGGWLLASGAALPTAPFGPPGALDLERDF